MQEQIKVNHERGGKMPKLDIWSKLRWKRDVLNPSRWTCSTAAGRGFQEVKLVSTRSTVSDGARLIRETKRDAARGGGLEDSGV